MGLQWVSPGELKANPKNWRRHPRAQRDALAGALREIGFADALIARETPEGLELIDGHLRREIGGMEKVPVLVVDLDEEEAAKLLVTLDPLAAMAQPDMDALLALLQEVKFESPDVTALLEALANGETQPMPFPGQTDPDEVPPEPEETYVQRGDIWLCGEHRVMCGDSKADASILLDGSIPQLMVTDPPYGVGYETDGKNPRWRKDNRPIENDDLEDDQESFWFDCFSTWPLNGDAYVFSPPGPPIAALARAIITAGIEHHQWLIWVKDRFALGRSHYHYRHEHIFYGWKGKSSWQGRRDLDSVWNESRPQTSPEHPTMKPVVLVERAVVNSSKQGAIVADPFLGSGSTLIACERLGRVCYGMEIEPRYVQVAIERWQNYTGKQAVKLDHGD